MRAGSGFTRLCRARSSGGGTGNGGLSSRQDHDLATRVPGSTRIGVSCPHERSEARARACVRIAEGRRPAGREPARPLIRRAPADLVPRGTAHPFAASRVDVVVRVSARARPRASGAGFGRYVVVLVDRSRLQTSVGGTREASRERAERVPLPKEGVWLAEVAAVDAAAAKGSLAFTSPRSSLRGEESATGTSEAISQPRSRPKTPWDGERRSGGLAIRSPDRTARGLSPGDRDHLRDGRSRRPVVKRDLRGHVERAAKTGTRACPGNRAIRWVLVS